MAYLVSFVFFFCFCFTVSPALHLSVDGFATEVVEGAPLSTSLAFSQDTVVADSLINSNACIFINGDVCDCLSGAYGHMGHTWSAPCVAARTKAIGQQASVHFSLLLIYPRDHTNADLKRVIATSPVFEPLGYDSLMITLVLPLTLDDVSRSGVLLHTLKRMKIGVVKEMLVFVPDSQLSIVRGAILGMAAECLLSFPVTVHSELKLFHIEGREVKQMHSYAVQMAVKLLAAQFVSTQYYLTLDADILQLRGFDADALYHHAPEPSLRGNTASHQALYHWEKRSVHEAWWVGSERVLNISRASSHAYRRWSSDEDLVGFQSMPPPGYISPAQRARQGFGVTPALLSTYGSQLTVFHLCRSLTGNQDYSRPIDRADCERRWLGDFARRVPVPVPGRSRDADIMAKGAGGEGGGSISEEMILLWSEYTLYRVALDHYEVFDELHLSEEEAEAAKGMIGGAGTRLHCHNVWFARQLPWAAAEASRAKNCLFSVVQSTSGVSPGAVFNLYDAYFGQQ